MLRKKTDKDILRELNKGKEVFRPAKGVAWLGILGAVTGRQLSRYLDITPRKNIVFAFGLFLLLFSFIHWKMGKYRTYKYESVSFFLVGFAFVLIACADYVVKVCEKIIADVNILSIYIIAVIMIFIGIVIGYVGVFKEGGHEQKEMLSQTLYVLIPLLIISVILIIFGLFFA